MSLRDQFARLGRVVEARLAGFRVGDHRRTTPEADAADKGLRRSFEPNPDTGTTSMLRTQASPASAASARVQLGKAKKACGHVAHVGTCSACQRAQLAKWQAQLAAVAH